MIEVDEQRLERAKTVQVSSALLSDRWICRSEGSKNEWLVEKENGGIVVRVPISKKEGFLVSTLLLLCKKMMRRWGS